MREFAAVVLGGCVTALHATQAATQAAEPGSAAAAKPFTLPTDSGGSYAHGHEAAVIVFYRGHW